MKTTGFKTVLVLSFCGILACGETHKEEFAADSNEAPQRSSALNLDSNASFEMGRSAAPEKPDSKEENHFNTAVGLVLKDTSRKIIRTADIRFEVGNLLAASKTLESKVLGLDGFVLSTRIQAENESQERKTISEDSILVIKSFDQVNHLVVRVPTKNLKTFLEEIFPLVNYLNYRNIEGEDVTINLLAEKMNAQRLDKYGKQTRQNIDQKGRKLRETQESENDLLERQQQADESRLEILTLADKLEYSTLHIEMYQKEMALFSRVVNVKETKAYEPGFFQNLGEAFLDGWDLLKAIALFIVRVWGLLLLASVTVFIVLKLNSPKRKDRSKTEG